MNGRIVQLQQGERLAFETDDIDAWIARFSTFPIVQLIDLDAAMGRGSNDALVERICGALPCQVGGGVRTIDIARARLGAGARRVIVGSALFEVRSSRSTGPPDHRGARHEAVHRGRDSRAGKSSFTAGRRRFPRSGRRASAFAARGPSSQPSSKARARRAGSCRRTNCARPPTAKSSRPAVSRDMEEVNSLEREGSTAWSARYLHWGMR